MTAPLVIVAALILAAGVGTFGYSLINPSSSNKSQPESTASSKPKSNSSTTSASLQLTTLDIEEEKIIAPISCSDGSLAVNLLIDTSKSMDGNKMEQTKSAINNFVKKLPDNTLIGVQTFSRPRNSGYSINSRRGNNSDENKDSDRTSEVLIEYAKLGEVRQILTSDINKLEAEGSTPMRAGFERAQSEISLAKTKFPDYKSWVLIFLSDGAPSDGLDPKAVASDIKRGLGVRIITVGISPDERNGRNSGRNSGDDSDENKTLLLNISSSQSDYYEPTETQVSQAYESILKNICS